MSLLDFIHKNIVVKFSDAGKEQYGPHADHVFRLDGVDAMGFLLIRAIDPAMTGDLGAGEAFWINKDLVREIREFTEAKTPEPVVSNSQGESVPPAKKPSKKTPKPKAVLL